MQTFLNVRTFLASMLIFSFIIQQVTAQYQGTTEIGRTMYATITDPTVNQLLSVANSDPINSRSDYYDEKTTISGIAQRNSPMNLYVFAKVPELIPDFTASANGFALAPESNGIPTAHAAGASVTLEWTPRSDFTCSGAGCRSNGQYHAVLNASTATFNLRQIAAADLLAAPSCPSQYTTAVDCEGGTCAYTCIVEESWTDEDGRTINPAAIEEEEKTTHTYTQTFTAVVNATYNNHGTNNNSTQLCHNNSPQNLFTILDKAYAATPGGSGGGNGSGPPGPGPGGGSSSMDIPPTCSMNGSFEIASKSYEVYVDDFVQYVVVYGREESVTAMVASPQQVAFIETAEALTAQDFDNPDNIVYADRGVSYYLNERVIPANAHNPYTNTAVVSGLDPSKTYRFALFEVRRETCYDKTPDPDLGQYEVSPYPENADCYDAATDLVDTAGYLYTARTQTGGNEVRVGPGNSVTYPTNTRDKVELEHVKNVMADTDEHFDVEIYKMSLNPAAKTHFVAATYLASDVSSSSVGDPSTISISSSSKMAFFNITDTASGQWVLNPNISYANTAPNPYGVVYDTWTKEPIMDVSLLATGKSSTLGEANVSYEYFQRTNADGLFSFYLSPGRYQMSVQEIGPGGVNSFYYPQSSAITNCTSTPVSPYTDQLYQGKTLSITQDKSAHNDIPLSPVLCGTTVPNATIYLVNQDAGNGKVYSTLSFPDGKYSFFVPAGNYRFEKLIKEDGNVENLAITKTIPASLQPSLIDINP